MKKSIAVIFHENQIQSDVHLYAIWHLAEIWREEGINVVFLFGVDQFIPADLAILHVDLTVVPDMYLEFAQRYPVVLNSQVKDIRKSLFSKQIVRWKDKYEGKVIVKSDLNHAGLPEQRLSMAPLSRLALRIRNRLVRYWTMIGGRGLYIRSPRDYAIFANVHSVPQSWFSRNDIIVEKFLPEKDNGLYCLRNYHFLGNHGFATLRKSKHPIVNATTAIRGEMEILEPHPEIVALTKRMKFNYGKFDYVMHEGSPLLLDTNRTPYGGLAPRYLDGCREWAKGIRPYL